MARPQTIDRLRRLAARPVVRIVAISMPVVLAAGVLVSIPALARAGFTPPPVQKIPSVPVKPVHGLGATPDPAAAAAKRPHPAPKWPAAGTADVAMAPAAGTAAAARTPQQAGSLPVYVGPASGPGTSAATAGTTPSRVHVELLDQSQSARAHRPGVLLRLARTDGATDTGRVRVSLDYAAVRNAYGADWATRLRLVALPACALSTPDSAACRGTALPSSNDARHARVSADVTLPGAPTGGVRADALGANAVLVAATAGPSGTAGDFTATPLAPSSTWQAGGSSGDFEWTYPMRVPQSLGGPAPGVALSYSSQSVDGRNQASNNQPSVVGEGFELATAGFIERRYKACSDDMGGSANNTTKTGDECWGTDNATLSMGGHSGELIYNSGDGTWHLRHDDGTRVVRLTGTSNGSYNGEYWRVTTVDGTQYYFGRNRIPGWSAGRPETNSTNTVPVFGNNPGEPCHQSTFDASYCQQGYRWNLDYVVDLHGNSMSYWYAQETNQYARDADQNKLSTYVRGGWLTRVDYGTRTDAEFGTAPMQVRFDMADRCDTDCGTHDGTHWTDTPWDMECTKAPCYIGSPTFWTTKRLAAVTTSVWGGSAYRDVDRWNLRQTYPDPGDATRAGLWLAGITHSGLVGGSLTLPEVSFVGVQLNNRVDTSSDQLPAMNWWRIHAITNETGGEVTVGYSDPDCIPGSRMPSSPDSNTLRCMPIIGDFQDDPKKVDWFHKYVVTSVIETDHSGGGPHVVTVYNYVGTPAWHADDDDGLVPASRKSWAQWRGYDRVQVLRGDPGEQTLTETLFYRGMDGDLLASGGTKHVTVNASDGSAVDDSDAFAGMPRESISYNVADRSVLGASIQDAWQSAPTASRTISGHTVYARFTRTGAVHTRVALDGGRGFRRGDITTTFNGYGLPLTVDDRGDAASTADDRCTRYTYTPNTDPNVWLVAEVSEVETDALPCGTAPSSAGDVVSDERTSYDNQAFGATPTRGDRTATQALSAWSSSGSTYVTTARWTYDSYGRITDNVDALGAHASTAYTPATGGPVTAVSTTDPLGFTTTVTNEPAWAQPTATVDANGKRTDVAYDPLGRVSAVWLPGWAKTDHPDNPSRSFAYQYRTDAATTVTAKTINAAGNYVTSYVLYDSFLRKRQTQQPSPVGGGRVITDTFYDTVGRVSLAYGAYYNSSPPGGDLVQPQSSLVPNQTREVYDSGGRVTASIFQPGGIEKWRTSTTYGGDRTDVVPPRGASAVSTVDDFRGRTVQLRQFHGNSLTGTPDVTTYTYNRQGLLDTVTDPAGNRWHNAYDPRGRTIQTDDPNRGTTHYTYDDDNRIATSTDARNLGLSYVYDAAGRLTEVHSGLSSSGPLRSRWTYDTIAKGQLTSSTTYDNGNPYTVAVTGYNDLYQPTGSAVTIPAAEGALARTYTFGVGYNVDGSVRTMSMPAAGGLSAETLTYNYDPTLGLPTTLKTNYGGLNSQYVASTTYSELGALLETKLSTGSGGSLYRDFSYEVDTGRLHEASVSRTAVTPNTLADVTYTYDPAGNLTKMVDAPAGGATDTQCFQQDHLARLTQAWTPASGDCGTAPANGTLGGPAPYWQTFSYDRSGNRRTAVDHATANGDVTTTYTVPPAGGPQPNALSSTSTTDSTGTRTANYGYDKDGNTTSRPGTTAGSTQTLAWDDQGLLDTITEGPSVTSFVYDGSGQRLVRRDPSGTTVYLGPMELRLDKSTNVVTGTRYYNHAAGCIAVRTRSGVSWVATDAQGTSDIEVNAATQAAQVRRQTPFGGARGTAPGGWVGERGFVGGTDDPTGLVNLGARQYDPQTGRFLSVDPVVNPGDPQALNGYAYSDNDPVNKFDPTGRDWWDTFNKVMHEIETGTLAVLVFSMCEGLLAEDTGPLSLPICGGVSSVAVYMAEVAAGNKKFSVEDLVHEFVIGAALGVGGALLADVLRFAAGIIRKIGAKIFGKVADEVASALEKEAGKDSGGGKPDNGGGDPGSPGGDGSPGTDGQPGTPDGPPATDPTTTPKDPTSSDPGGKPADPGKPGPAAKPDPNTEPNGGNGGNGGRPAPKGSKGTSHVEENQQHQETADEGKERYERSQNAADQWQTLLDEAGHLKDNGTVGIGSPNPPSDLMADPPIPPNGPVAVAVAMTVTAMGIKRGIQAASRWIRGIRGRG
jgi:RHS repeat-associated protein